MGERGSGCVMIGIIHSIAQKSCIPSNFPAKAEMCVCVCIHTYPQSPHQLHITDLRLQYQLGQVQANKLLNKKKIMPQSITDFIYELRSLKT